MTGVSAKRAMPTHAHVTTFLPLKRDMRLLVTDGKDLGGGKGAGSGTRTRRGAALALHNDDDGTTQYLH